MSLESAIRIACSAHEGQRYGTGPYILHPLRVMLTQHSIDNKIIAILHDVVEDSAITFEDLLLSGFPEIVINPLRILTRTRLDGYEFYIERCRGSSVATQIKIADLTDHLAHIESLPPDKKHSLRMRYTKALQVLTNAT
jgi:hypothetical protein